MKDSGSTGEVLMKPINLRISEEKGITIVGVKSVESGKNAGGEGAFPGYT